jgi:putative acetyltransferase
MMDNIIIKEVEVEDNLPLAQMIRAVFIEHGAPQNGTVYSDPTTFDLYSLFRKGKSILWVANLGNEIVGCCGIYPTEGLDEDTTELVKFYLPATARGKGIGRALMEKSIASAKGFGYKRIYLESLPHYSKAVSIYEKNGFKQLGKPLGNSGHTSCNIWMIKELDV